MKSYLKFLEGDRMYPYRVFGDKTREQPERLLILRSCEVVLNIEIEANKIYEILDTRIKTRRSLAVGGDTDTLINIRTALSKFLKLGVEVKNIEKIYFILKEKSA